MASKSGLNNSQDIRNLLDEIDEEEGTPEKEPEVIMVEPMSTVGQIINRSTTIPLPAKRPITNVLNSKTVGGSASSELWKRQQPGKRQSSLAWNYFKYDKLLDASICKINNCDTRLRGKNTTNLKKHLKDCHKDEFSIVCVADNKQDGSKSLLTSQNEINSKGQQRLDLTGRIAGSKYEPNHPKQQKFKKQIAILFGSNPIPNHLIANDDFRKTYNIADSKLALQNELTLGSDIDKIVSEVRENIMERLALARRISISSDIWTKKGMSSSYLGVMATFYDAKEETKVNAVLAVSKFSSVHHTAPDVIREMQISLDKYDVPKQKIWKMVTDSGSNMVCAFRDELEDLQSEQATILENENAEVRNGKDAMQSERDEAGSELSEYSRLSCFIHTLLLCLKKFEVGKLFAHLILKVKKLVSKFSTSQVLTGELLRLSGFKLVNFSTTRWNTTFIVLQRLIKVKQSILVVLETSGKLKHNLTESEWKIIEEIQGFLFPFNKYTDMSSTEGTRALSEVIMILKELKVHLRKYFIVKNFVGVSKLIFEDISRRFGHFFSEPSDKPFEGVYLASTLLDPRYRIGLDALEVDLAKKYILSLNSAHFVGSSQDTGDNFLQQVEPESGKKRKFEFLNAFTPNKSLEHNNLMDEVKSYLENSTFDVADDKCDPWKFWNQQKHSFPKLAPIALDILSVPISIGAVERVFSFAGLATCGRRNRLDGPNLEREIFLNKNKSIFLSGLD